MKNFATHKMSGMISKSLEQPAEAQPYFDTTEFQDILSDMILRALDGEDVLKECAGHDFLTSLMVDVVEHAKGDESPEVKACVAKKIPILMDEGYQQKQAIAIAFSQCSKDPSVAEKAKEVPKQDKGKMTDENLRQMGRDRLASIDGTKIPSISNTREVNLSVTEDQGLAATFLPSYARRVASPGREVKEIEEADRISKDGTTEGAKKGWDTRRAGGEGGGYVSPGMPIKGHPYHEKTEAELKYIIQDAGEAAQNMRGHDPKAEGKYLDQVNDAHTVLAYRKRQGISGPLKLPKNDTEKELPFVDSSLGKEGTPEGVKRAWETRRGGAPVEEEEKKPKQSAEGILAQAVREAMQEHLTQRQQKPPEPKPAPKKDPGDLDIDISGIKPPDLSDWDEGLKRTEEAIRAKEEAAAREAEEKKQARDWNQKMRYAQRTFDSKAVAQLRAKMPERIKMQQKDLMDKVLAVLERHGISKAGNSEGAKKGWESRKHGKQIANEAHWSYLKRISQDRASRANERIGQAKGETTEEKITNYVSDESTASLNHEERKQRLLDLAALGLERNHPAVQQMFAKV